MLKQVHFVRGDFELYLVQDRHKFTFALSWFWTRFHSTLSGLEKCSCYICM